jgi:dimethylargininase
MPDGTTFTRAVVCPPADSYADGLTTSELGPPDLTLARTQHAAYRAALERAGVQVTALPADTRHPDSTFVEDTAVVAGSGAILTRPGAPSRAGEVEAMRVALGEWFDDLAEIQPPGTLDGGDVCQVGTRFVIGISRRTNPQGARQLTAWLARHDYTSALVPIGTDPTLLHLKSGMAWLGAGRVVVVPSLADHPALTGFERIVVDAGEAYAANCVRVNGTVLVPAGFPRITDTLDRLGFQVLALDMSEFRKMDGGLSCLSVRLP